jgi:hypothetical protein
MHNLNRQRANLVFSHLLAYDKALTPGQVARLEVVFERDGVLRWLGGEVLGRASIGVGMGEVVLACGKGRDDGGTQLYTLGQLFEDEEYLLCADEAGSTVRIALKRGCSPRGQLKSWLHALIHARQYGLVRAMETSERREEKKSSGGSVGPVAASLERTRAVWAEFEGRLSSAGWTMDEAALETGCGPRIVTCEAGIPEKVDRTTLT